MEEDNIQIISRLHQFADAYDRRSLPELLATFTSRIPPTVFGTGGDLVIGRPALERRFKREFLQTTNLAIRPEWFDLQVAGNMAWLTALSQACASDHRPGLTANLTAILAKEDNGWRIAHLHFSFRYEQRRLNHRSDSLEEDADLPKNVA